MNKKLTAVAVAAALAAPAAFAEATIYGSLHTSLGKYDVDFKRDGEKFDAWDVVGEDGQLGIQGSEDLGGGLTALYKVEFNFDTSGGPLDSQCPEGSGVSEDYCEDDSTLTWDEVWIGFTGDWGTALIGREDTPYKTFMDSAGVDILGDSIVDVDDMLKITDEAGHAGFERFTANGAIAYVSPNFSGFTFGAAVIPGGQGESSDGDNFQGLSVEDGIADHYSLGANYVGGGLRVAVAYENKVPLDWGGDSGLPTDKAAADDQENWGIGASYTFGGFMVGAKYEEEDNVNFFKDEDAERWAVSGKYTFGNNEVGVVYVDEERDSSGTGSASEELDADGWGIFAAHNFSPRTKVYAAYSDVEGDNKTGSLKESIEADAFAIGVIHSF